MITIIIKVSDRCAQQMRTAINLSSQVSCYMHQRSTGCVREIRNQSICRVPSRLKMPV